MKYYKTITAEILKCDITKLDEIQSFVGKEYHVKLNDDNWIEISPIEDPIFGQLPHKFILENNSYIAKYDDSLRFFSEEEFKEWHPILNIKWHNKKVIIDKSKWNRALDGKLPEDGQEVFYWFEYTGLNQGIYERNYCEELNAWVHIFCSVRGFLSDEDVYWLPKDALPFEFIYEEEK